MADPKFTPGPWSVTTPTDVMHAVRNAKGGIVADVGYSNTLEENDANASLIAAAPELYEACETFAEWLRREDAGFDLVTHDRNTPEGEAAWREWYDGNLDLCALAQKQARAALAKARGES